VRLPAAVSGSVVSRSGCLYCREGGVGVLMASARTIFELAHCVQYLRRVDFFMRIRFEFRRMTTSTIRLIGSKLPGNDLVVRLVTRGACEAVVRFVRG
jgi:hypothetical protein